MSAMPPPPPMSPPPGYVPYGGGGAYGGQFQAIRGLTKWLNGLLIASLIGSLVAVVALLLVIGPAQDFADNTISRSELVDKLGILLAVSALLAVISIASIVILIIWTYRLAKNMAVLGRHGQSMSRPGATIAINLLGGCTLGILNFLMWREIWRGSDPESPPGDAGWKSRAVGLIVNIWFGLTAANVVVSLVASGSLFGGSGGVRATTSDGLADQLNDQLTASILTSVLSLGVSVVFIMLVRQLSARHMKATGEAA